MSKDIQMKDLQIKELQNRIKMTIDNSNVGEA